MTVEHKEYRQITEYENEATLFDDIIAGLRHEYVRDGDADDDMKERIAKVLRHHAEEVDPDE